MVTSPTMSPYSSTTMARWTVASCSSRSSSSQRLVSGTNAGLADEVGPPLAPVGRDPAQQVLGVDDPDDRCRGRRRPGRGCGRRRARRRRATTSSKRRVLAHGDHVGPRDHDLAHARVGELEDGADHRPLLGLELLVLLVLVGGRRRPRARRRSRTAPTTPSRRGTSARPSPTDTRLNGSSARTSEPTARARADRRRSRATAARASAGRPRRRRSRGSATSDDDADDAGRPHRAAPSRGRQRRRPARPGRTECSREQHVQRGRAVLGEPQQRLRAAAPPPRAAAWPGPRRPVCTTVSTAAR